MWKTLLVFAGGIVCFSGWSFGQNIEKIATGFQFTEGPCWIDTNGGYLLFSDIDANKVYQWSEAGGLSEFIANSGNSNGIATDMYGNIYLAQQGNRQIGKLNSDGTIETLCSSYGGKRLNSPNDLVVKSNGTIFFTDPDYGVSAANKEQTANGVYYLLKASTEPVQFIGDLSKPNGIAFSPDEWNLYVCDSELQTVYRYELKVDGTIRKKFTFTVVGNEIDGIKTDLDGNVYVAVSNVGVQIYSPAGTLVQTIALPEKTRNLAWGDRYKNTLYITAGNSIYKIKINPDFPFIQAELLTRPTDQSVTLSMMAETDVEMYVEYGSESLSYTMKTATVSCTHDISTIFEVDGCEPDKQYFYRVRYRMQAEESYQARPEFTFHTQRKKGSSFTFDVQADPHLDEASNMQTYLHAMQNTANDAPDFMIDLGDNFMSDKLPILDYDHIEKRAWLFRHFYEKVAHSAPLYMVIGNHEAEAGWELNGTAENVAVWNTLIRKKYYPNPEPSSFYTGCTSPESFVGIRQNYYAWTWGDALFVAIDPYWYTETKPSKSSDGWNWTLGETQYRWLQSTLENSNAKFKFVFCHQIVGGDDQGRGGTEKVKYFEMGGYNSDGTYGFNEERPGWEKPLHQLFVENHVNIYFHGHDHFFARQELDGVIYQLAPQPSLFNYTTTSMATEYGYNDGIILPNSGHLRVNLSGDLATIDYIKAFDTDDASKNQVNATVAYSYTISANATSSNRVMEVVPSVIVRREKGLLRILLTSENNIANTMDVYDLTGQKVTSLQREVVSNTASQFVWQQPARGIYLGVYSMDNRRNSIKLVVK